MRGRQRKRAKVNIKKYVFISMYGYLALGSKQHNKTKGPGREREGER